MFAVVGDVTIVAERGKGGGHNHMQMMQITCTFMSSWVISKVPLLGK
jgi:hypothetical protein